MLGKLNVNLAIGLALIGLIVGLFISNGRKSKEVFELTTKATNLARQDSLKSVRIKELSGSDSLKRKNIEKMQKDFLVYRDSFLLYKNHVFFNDRIITINKVQKCLSKKVSYDTLIVHKNTIEKKK